MNEREKGFYLNDLFFQAENAQLAFEELVKYSKQIKTINFSEMNRYTSLLWIMIQSFLSAAANISKMLWSLENPNRSKELRITLNIPEEHILTKTKFRNHFEHFDTRIDKWAKRSGKKHVIDRIIGDKSKIRIKDLDSECVFRHYDPNTMELTFYEEPYYPKAIVKEIKVIQDKVSETLNLSRKK